MSWAPAVKPGTVSSLSAPDSSGAVIAPQHVFLGGDGSVLLSVPYEVSSLELQWCFGEAWRLAGAEGDS